MCGLVWHCQVPGLECPQNVVLAKQGEPWIVVDHAQLSAVLFRTCDEIAVASQCDPDTLPPHLPSPFPPLAT